MAHPTAADLRGIKIEIKATAKLYLEGKITIREASDITGIPLRGILHEFGIRGTYIRYSENELKEDIE